MLEYSFAINADDYDPKNFEVFFDEDSLKVPDMKEEIIDVKDEYEEYAEDKEVKEDKERKLIYPYAITHPDLVHVSPSFDFLTLNPHILDGLTVDDIKSHVDCTKLGFVDFSIKTPPKLWSGVIIAVAYKESFSDPTWKLYRLLQKAKPEVRLESESQFLERSQRWFHQILSRRLNSVNVPPKCSNNPFSMILVGPKRTP